MQNVSLAFVDDHNAYRIGVTRLIHEFGPYTVTIQAIHGKDFIEKLATAQEPPAMVLLDICMKVMDGYDTASWLQQNHPQIKIVVVSQSNEPLAMERMAGFGAATFLLKDEHPDVLRMALDALQEVEYFFGGTVGREFKRLVSPSKYFSEKTECLTAQQVALLRYCPTPLSCNEIAGKMELTKKQADHLFEKTFEKTGTRNRYALAGLAIKMGLTPPLNSMNKWW